MVHIKRILRSRNSNRNNITDRLELIRTIKAINDSYKYYSINAGGCIHFAYFFSKALKERGIKHDLISLTNSWETVDTIFQYGCRHVLVYIPRIGYVDSNKISSRYTDFGYYGAIKHIIPESYDINSIRNDTELWNNEYNRKYNATLGRVISTKFKTIYDNRGI